MFGLYGWNAGRDWTGTLVGTEGFRRGDGSRWSSLEGEAPSFVFRDSGRSIIPHGLGTSLGDMAINGMHNAVSGDIVPVDKERREAASVIRGPAWRLKQLAVGNGETSSEQ